MASTAAWAVRESYIHLVISDRAQISQLTNVISITNVVGNDVYAVATDPMLAELTALGYSYNTLPSLKKDAVIKMAKSASEVKKSWQAYPTYEQYVEILQGFAAQYPNICRLQEIGLTQQGRTQYVLKITDNPDVAEDEPEVFFTATMHGDEPLGFMLMLRLADQILSGYGTDPRLTALVNNEELWINPLSNPDGTYAGGNDTIKYATRTLANGLDFNRNFPTRLAGEHPDGNPFAPETVAMMNFATLHHFTLSASFHSGNEVLNYPWDESADRHPDDAFFIALSRAYATQAQLDGPKQYMTQLDNGITNGWDWFEVNGGRQDYMTAFQGDREVTIELSIKYMVNATEVERYWVANNNAMLGYMEAALTGVRGIVTNAAGEPLAATVEVVGIPDVGVKVSSDPWVGNYHRMLVPGVYTVRIAAPGYQTAESTLTVNAGPATRWDVVLLP